MALSTPSELVFPCKGLCTRVSRQTAILEVRPWNLWVRGCIKDWVCAVVVVSVTRVLAMASVNSATLMKKADLGLLEEDDEFEEFPAEGNTYPFIGHLS